MQLSTLYDNAFFFWGLPDYIPQTEVKMIADLALNNSFSLAATYGAAGIILTVLGFLFWSGQKQPCHFVRSTAGRT